jgi:hypothetical protein
VRLTAEQQAAVFAVYVDTAGHAGDLLLPNLPRWKSGTNDRQ